MVAGTVLLSKFDDLQFNNFGNFLLTNHLLEFGKDSTPVVAHHFACPMQWLPIYRLKKKCHPLMLH